ncbi:MAG: DUF1266 domain-containing protein [Bacteroidota bacterium]
MIDARPILLALLGTWFLIQARRAMKKKQIKGVKDEKSSGQLGYYRILGAYLMSGVALWTFALGLFYQLYGWQGLSVSLLTLTSLGLLIWRFKQIQQWLWGRMKAAVPKIKVGKQKETLTIDPHARNWALAAAAMFSRVKGWEYTTLAGSPPQTLQQKTARRKLNKEWDIGNEEDLAETIEWLREIGHRHEFQEIIQRVGQFSPEEREVYIQEIGEGKYDLTDPDDQEEERHRVQMIYENTYNIRFLSFIAWDFLRLMDVVRMGVRADMMDEKTAWSHLLSAAQVLQSRYDSWKEMGEQFVHAREFWSIVETRKEENMYDKALKELLRDPESPWNQLAWEMSLYKR